jgi:hypothetical protein
VVNIDVARSRVPAVSAKDSRALARSFQRLPSLYALWPETMVAPASAWLMTYFPISASTRQFSSWLMSSSNAPPALFILSRHC